MSTSSKRKRFGGNTTVTKNLGAIVDQSRADSVASELIPISKVIPDAENARTVKLDFDNPAHIAPDDPQIAEKQAELELIQGLARTIDSIGLINPVQVYRVGNSYQLVTGHRRLLAHKLSGRETILASIHRSPRTRQSQFAENYQRKATSLPERLISMLQLVDELDLRDADSKEIAGKLRDLTGLRERAAYRWSAILTGHEEVREAINEGRIVSTRSAEQICAMPRDEAVMAIAALGQEDAGEGGETRTAEPPVRRERQRGRPKTSVALGKVKNPDIVRYVVTQVMGEDAVTQVDWSDYEAVSKAFQDMLNQVAEKLK